jgi:hypothetical protein
VPCYAIDLCCLCTCRLIFFLSSLLSVLSVIISTLACEVPISYTRVCSLCVGHSMVRIWHILSLTFVFCLTIFVKQCFIKVFDCGVINAHGTFSLHRWIRLYWFGLSIVDREKEREREERGKTKQSWHCELEFAHFIDFKFMWVLYY